MFNNVVLFRLMEERSKLHLMVVLIYRKSFFGGMMYRPFSPPEVVENMDPISFMLICWR